MLVVPRFGFSVAFPSSGKAGRSWQFGGAGRGGRELRSKEVSGCVDHGQAAVPRSDLRQAALRAYKAISRQIREIRTGSMSSLLFSRPTWISAASI
jgi:hypothetical protein